MANNFLHRSGPLKIRTILYSFSATLLACVNR